MKAGRVHGEQNVREFQRRAKYVNIGADVSSTGWAKNPQLKLIVVGQVRFFLKIKTKVRS